jgi:5-formyltetrahydrofolate cyclo-ligase
VTIQEKKIRLRNRMLQKLREQSPKEQEDKSVAISNMVRQDDAVKHASVIMAYVSVDGEVQTVALIKDMLQSGKRVFVPRVNSKQDAIECVEISDVDRDLVPGHFGIPEPGAALKATGDCNELNVVLVPGVAFDQNGGRLGRGKGFYDRFLNTLPKSVARIGLSYDIQLCAEIPTTDADERVDRVVTNLRRPI